MDRWDDFWGNEEKSKPTKAISSKPPPAPVSPLTSPTKPPPPPLVLTNSEPEIRIGEASAPSAMPASSESEFYRNQYEKLSEELKEKTNEIAQLKSALQLQQQSGTKDAVDLLTNVVNDALSLTLETDTLEARIDSKVNPPCSGVSVHFLLTPKPPEGYSIQWFRSFAGSLFEKIEGATSPTYTPNADDIGAVLKSKVTSVDGEHSEAEAGPVMVKKELVEKLVEFSKKGAFNLEVDSGSANGPSTLQVTKKNIKLKMGRKTDLLGEFGPGFRVDLVQHDKFCVKSPHWNAEHTFTAPKEQRDLYVLALRLMNSYLPENEHDNSVRWQIVQLNASKLQGLAQDSQALRIYNSELGRKLDRIRKVLKRSGVEEKAEQKIPKNEEVRKPDDERPQAREPKREPEKKTPSAEDPDKEAAPRELKYDAEGFLVVDEAERGFKSYDQSKYGSDSDEEDKKPQFKLAIRPEGAPLPTQKTIPTLSRPDLPKKAREDKKTLKRGQTAAISELAGAGWAGVDAFPTMQVEAFHEVKFMTTETVNVTIRDGNLELLDIRGELNLARVASELSLCTIPFEFRGNTKTVVANEPAISVEQAGSYTAKFHENQTSLSALKYIIDCDSNDARNMLPLFAKVLWDCQPNETIVEVNYDVNPQYKNTLTGIKFLFTINPPASVSKCVLPKGLCKAQGLWNPKTQQLLWKLPPSADKGQLLFRLTTSAAIAPSPMEVFFTGELRESLVTINASAPGVKQTHTIKAGKYAVFPSLN